MKPLASMRDICQDRTSFIRPNGVFSRPNTSFVPLKKIAELNTDRISKKQQPGSQKGSRISNENTRAEIKTRRGISERNLTISQYYAHKFTKHEDHNKLNSGIIQFFSMKSQDGQNFTPYKFQEEYSRQSSVKTAENSRKEPKRRRKGSKEAQNVLIHLSLNDKADDIAEWSFNEDTNISALFKK